MKKKIGLVVFNITAPAGTEKAIVNLANILTEFGKGEYAVSILSLETSTGAPFYKLNDEVNIIHCDLHTTFSNFYEKLKYYPLAIRRIRRIAKELDLNYLLGSTHAINSLLLFACRSLKTHAIACEHFPYHATKNISKIIRRIIYPHLDAVVVLTENDKKNYSSFIKKIFVIPNAKDRVTNHNISNNNIALAVGRFTYQKGFDMLIEAWSKIEVRNNWKLYIIGEGEDKPMLTKKIAELNLQDSIFLKGSTPNINEYYKTASLYIMSSRFEGFPMVLVEASGFGLPLISFDCPYGPSDIIINHSNGFLVENGNTDKLAEAITLVINDENLRTQMSNESFLLSERFSPEKIYLKWNDLFNQITLL